MDTQIILSCASSAVWPSVSITQKTSDLVLEDIEQDGDKEGNQRVSKTEVRLTGHFHPSVCSEHMSMTLCSELKW